MYKKNTEIIPVGVKSKSVRNYLELQLQIFLAQFIVVVAFRMELVFTNVYKTLNYMSGRQFCWFNKEVSSAIIWDKQGRI